MSIFIHYFLRCIWATFYVSVQWTCSFTRKCLVFVNHRYTKMKMHIRMLSEYNEFVYFECSKLLIDCIIYCCEIRGKEWSNPPLSFSKHAKCLIIDWFSSFGNYWLHLCNYFVTVLEINLRMNANMLSKSVRIALVMVHYGMWCFKENNETF